MTSDPEIPDHAQEPGTPEPVAATGRRQGAAFWRWMFVGSLAALVVVVAFGAGMISERILFAGGGLFERARGLGGPSSGSVVEMAELYPRYAETRDLIEDEFLFRPTDPDAAATFAAELEQGAIEGIAVAAATPVASLDEMQRQLDYGAARGAAGVLDDPYTVFLEPVEQAPLAEALEGEYEGIGVWVEHPEGRFVIVAPIPGSPAAAAGLQPGDVMLEADGVELTGLSNEEGLKLIRGPAGSTVTLLIGREGEEPFPVEVERQAIAIPSVIYEPQADGQVAWISVAVFGDKTTAQLDEALRRAEEEGVAGVVLDLRGNGGGWVTSAREMVGRFVPEDRGPALYEDETAGDDDEPAAESILGGGAEWFDRPLAVLVDGGSASASEIVAGALRDYDRAVLVGQPTFGKGLVQRVHNFPDGSSARITFARWLTPNLLPIPEEGIAPDVAVAWPDPPDGTDPQLAAAVNAVLAEAELPPATPVAPAATPGATPLAATPEATPVAEPEATPVGG